MNSEAFLQRIEWTVMRRLDGLLQGDYRTLFRGFGVDLADLREYQYSDDVRHIDWNVTARLQVPHVRQFVEDRDVTAWFLVDLTDSMQFGSGDKRKADIVLETITLLARVMTKHGNRVGALIYRGGDTIAQVLPARTGRRQVLTLIDLLTKPHSAKAVKDGARKTNLARFFHAAGAAIKRRSLVFVASDFISDPDWSQSLGQLARRHEVIALRSSDPLENSLPDLGLIVIEDSETGEQLQVDTHDAGFRSRFASLALERSNLLKWQFDQSGVDSLEIGAPENLMAFAEKRRRMPRNAMTTNAMTTNAINAQGVR
jgi:uncharacterized protein (DUF58 family)